MWLHPHLVAEKAGDQNNLGVVINAVIEESEINDMRVSEKYHKCRPNALIADSLILISRLVYQVVLKN